MRKAAGVGAAMNKSTYEYLRLDAHVETPRRGTARIDEQRKAAQDQSVRRLQAAPVGTGGTGP